jgi:hypothetical protein
MCSFGAPLSPRLYFRWFIVQQCCGAAEPNHLPCCSLSFYRYIIYCNYAINFSLPVLKIIIVGSRKTLSSRIWRRLTVMRSRINARRFNGIYELPVFTGKMFFKTILFVKTSGRLYIFYVHWAWQSAVRQFSLWQFAVYAHFDRYAMLRGSHTAVCHGPL